jgi:hypothetical protein
MPTPLDPARAASLGGSDHGHARAPSGRVLPTYTPPPALRDANRGAVGAPRTPPGASAPEREPEPPGTTRSRRWSLAALRLLRPKAARQKLLRMSRWRGWWAAARPHADGNRPQALPAGTRPARARHICHAHALLDQGQNHQTKTCTVGRKLAFTCTRDPWCISGVSGGSSGKPAGCCCASMHETPARCPRAGARVCVRHAGWGGGLCASGWRSATPARRSGRPHRCAVGIPTAASAGSAGPPTARQVARTPPPTVARSRADRRARSSRKTTRRDGRR